MAGGKYEANFYTDPKLVDLPTTQIYTQVSIEKLKQIHAATHPARAEMKEALLNTLAAEAEDELIH